VIFHGNRYPIACEVPMDSLVKYLKERYDLTLADNIKDLYKKPTKFPEPIVREEFVQEILNKQIDYSDLGEDRLFRSHGQSLNDIYSTRTGNIGRIPDIVLWPKNQDEVVSIVAIADKYDVVILPFGGGTSVSGAMTCPQNEKRPIAALDTTQMNRMLWLDKSNLVACFESGIVGQDLERVLNGEGFTMGHEPDSLEFSTLGGWVATRASGMKKNRYGNIEDMLIRVKMVTTKGVLERNVLAPRISAGPDYNHLVLGSEGTLGIITEVVVKIHQLPEVRKYDSIIFPDFESGFHFLREIAKKQCQPASIRLIDNEHFIMAQMLKSRNTWASIIGEKIKRGFLTTIKGFDLEKLAVATVLYEGEKNRVGEQQRTINQIAQKYGGYMAGSSYGEDGYKMTFVVAYIRVSIHFFTNIRNNNLILSGCGLGFWFIRREL
jgi:alkyldihydroxyacetonephosphate synthase